MLAEKTLVNREWEGQRRGQQDVGETVKRHLHRFEPGRALGEIADPRGESRTEKKKRDSRGEQKLPEDQPVAAFEIGVGLGPFVRRHRVKPGACRSGGIGAWRNRRRWSSD
jgi:hypothetical protein